MIQWYVLNSNVQGTGTEMLELKLILHFDKIYDNSRLSLAAYTNKVRLKLVNLSSKLTASTYHYVLHLTSKL